MQYSWLCRVSSRVPRSIMVVLTRVHKYSYDQKHSVPMPFEVDQRQRCGLLMLHRCGEFSST